MLKYTAGNHFAAAPGTPLLSVTTESAYVTRTALERAPQKLWRMMMGLTSCAARRLINIAACAGALLISSHALATQKIDGAGPIDAVFAGNSVGWRINVAQDRRSASVTPLAPYARPSDVIFLTGEGLEAFDLARDGKVTRNDDRRVIASGDTLEFAPARAVVLEFPAEITHVSWTRATALQTLVEVQGRFLAAKYAGSPDLRLTGPRVLTVNTANGVYTFQVTTGPGGAPIYRVVQNH
ncbi:hypothetical protein [Paraburkholderia sp. SIMBA_054]|uniref:hypothetical protein n=1 Tax=Paraburkholderia sp. SIMBA_054 TaxID=3085795 RepID=UPI003979BE71